MAIDKLKKVTFLCPITVTQRLLKTLHGLSMVEIVDVFERFEEAKDKLQRQEVSCEDCDRELQKINLILGLLDLFAPEKKSFVQGLAPVPLVVDPQELNRVKEQFPIDKYYAEANHLDTEFRQIERARTDIENRLKDLLPLRSLPFPVDSLKKAERFAFIFGAIGPMGVAVLQQNEFLAANAAVEEVRPLQDGDGSASSSAQKDKTWVIVACLKEHHEEVRKHLAACGFTEIPLPNISGTVRDQISALEEDLAELQDRVNRIREKVNQLVTHRHALKLLKAFWEDCKKLALTKTNCAHGRYIQIIAGYVREKDCPTLEKTLKADFPNVTICIEDLAPGEMAPVSLSLPQFVRPIQMLVDLFGRPAYNTFDPSPFIMPTFLLFFGICFSDAAYGSMLILFSLYIMYKTKPYPGVYNFAKLLFYAGISTLIFGLLLGSWFGDLYMPKYLGEDNIMYKIMKTTQVIDPLQKPIVVLLIALAIGMVNQFYGIALKMYSALLNGDRESALFDGLLWLVTLPGFVLLVSKMFAPVPTPVFYSGLVLFIVGAGGLVLTQGRETASLPSRLITGIISLYGIVGTYGITAFIGDTMSYCRLLALALTTGIVALSFNMMADLLRPIPYVGMFLFIFVLIIAHVFNFFISVLGAFVHSMRLIFVEFFGRFYITGSRPFAPLGFDSKTAILKR